MPHSPHYVAVNTVAVAIVRDVVIERNARVGNEQRPEVDLGQVLVPVLGVLQLVMKVNLMKQPKRSAGSLDYQPPTVHYVPPRASRH